MAIKALFVVTGKTHSGKTTLLENVVNTLREKGIPVSGFLSLTVHDAKGEISGYDLLDIETGDISPFLRRDLRNGIPVGRFFVSRRTLRKAQKILKNASGKVIFFDEFGILESKGNGLFKAFLLAIQKEIPIFVVTVRESLLRKFIEIKEKEFTETPLTLYRVEEGPGLLLKEILKLCQGNKGGP